MKTNTFHRRLETIVPQQHKKAFGLYYEEEPTFTLSAAPKRSEAPEADTAPVDNIPETDLAQGSANAKDHNSDWLVKKLVGLLRYSGAMAVELRGALPDEAYEVIDKLEHELEVLATALDPYVINKPESEEPDMEEEPIEEPESEPEIESPAPEAKEV